MNIGTKHSESRTYNIDQMIKDSNPGDVEKHVWDMLKRQFEQAEEWTETRGNTGDNIPIDEFAKLGDAIRNRKVPNVVESSGKILETKMHPTARDIIGDPCKNAIYNLCGKRAHNYRED